jgi:DNA repair photolyase
LDEPDEQLGFALAPDGERGAEPIGDAAVEMQTARSILTRASGFMSDYDFTLNPYSGCTFGCSYCYAAFFVRDQGLQDSWGEWVKVKSNAVQLLRRMRTPINGKRIYMSSVTDPYQPIERRLGLVRDLLEILVPLQPRLVVQTRSALVTRDIDLFKQLSHVRVNMTVTTDDERVRKAFEPRCTPNASRLSAIAEVARSGVPTAITMTPLLPVRDSRQFAATLRETEVQSFVVQPFHVTRGRFVAGTRPEAERIVRDLGWDEVAYQRVVDVLRAELPNLSEGKEGFAPA